MSQRKALIASLVITLVLALSAIGIRAAFFDSPDAGADPESGVTLVVPGSGEYDDDDDDYDRQDGSDDQPGSWIDAFTSHDDDDDDHHDEDYEDEEDHDDDEH